MKRMVLTAVLTAMVLGGCSEEAAVADTATKEPAAAMPDAVAAAFGKPIGKDLFEAFVRTRQGGVDISEEQRRELLTQFADLFVLTEGRELPLPPNAEQLPAAERELARLYNGVQQAVTDWQQQNPVEDTAVRERYAAFANAAVIRDYKLRHLNPVSAVAAGKLFDQLSGGTSFDQLETELIGSSGPVAAGALGWVPTDALTADVLASINNVGVPGYTAPLGSEYGGHILLVEAVRDVAPPAYEDIAEQLRGSIAQQRFEQYVAARRAEANIQIF